MRPLEEFKEIISLPKIGSKELKRRKDPSTVELSDAVLGQIRDYVTKIAGTSAEGPTRNVDHRCTRSPINQCCYLDMYKDNPFHNYERK